MEKDEKDEKDGKYQEHVEKYGKKTWEEMGNMAIVVYFNGDSMGFKGKNMI